MFRPLPWMTAFALLALGVLVALGVWQLQRADEKRAAIAAYEATRAERVFDDLAAPFCAAPSAAAGHRVRMPASVFGEPVRFYGARDSVRGFRILRLVERPDCTSEASAPSAIAIETDFETLNGRRLGPPDALLIAAAPRPSAFAAQNSADRGEYYRFEPEALAAAFGVAPETLNATVWLVADSDDLPPALADMPPARHIGYALTWIGLALTLIGVYVAYHVRAGRFGRAKD